MAQGDGQSQPSSSGGTIEPMRSNATAKRPTELQPRLLREIARYWRNNGIPPTLRELTGKGTRRSGSAVQRHLRRLEADGFLATTRGISRSIRLTDRGWAWAGLRRPCCRPAHDENGETDVDLPAAVQAGQGTELDGREHKEMPEVRA